MLTNLLFKNLKNKQKLGKSINAEPWKPNGKTLEEWVKYWVNSWFE